MYKIVEKCGIIQLAERVVDIMLELILLIIEKLTMKPMILIGILLSSIMFNLIIKYWQSYVYRCMYIEKEIVKITGLYLKKMVFVSFFIIFLTDFLVYISNIIYNETYSYKKYILYYIILLLLIVFQNIRQIYHIRKENYFKCLLYLLPGISIHIMWLVLLSCAKKSIYVIIGVIMLSIVTPSFLDVIVWYSVSKKDEKWIQIDINSGKTYSIRYKDYFEYKNDISIKFRDDNNHIYKTILINKDDVVKKTIFIKQFDTQSS